MTQVMLSNQRKALRWASSALLSFLLAGCGGGPTEATFELTGNDLMKYSVERLEVDAPATVTIRLKNIGEMPKIAMGHNLVLLRPGVDAMEFAYACATSGAAIENEHLPEKMRYKALGWTKVLGPGETDEVVVEVAEPGRYQYVCTFPGHFANMKGVLVAR